MKKVLRKGLETLLFAGGLLALSSTNVRANEEVVADTFRVTPDVEVTTSSSKHLESKLNVGVVLILLFILKQIFILFLS